MKCARCGGSGWVMFGYGETAGADACPVCIEGPEDMNLSFQPPEEDDPRDDDQRANALLPCPFCGNAKNIAIVNERHDHSGGYYIACPVCDASTGIRFACGDDPAPLLIEQWNRRATQPTASNAGEREAQIADAFNEWVRGRAEGHVESFRGGYRAALAQVPEQVAGDSEDAENYRWLCKHMIVPAPSLWDNGVGFVTPAFPRKSGAMTKPELDAAIRAARTSGEANHG